MKKELLMASALVGTMGVASVAEAVTATTSGNHRVGVEFDSATGSTDTNAVIEQSSLNLLFKKVPMKPDTPAIKIFLLWLLCNNIFKLEDYCNYKGVSFK